ncbi:hypothetical protein RCH17_000958 [Arthrobacter sp. MP_M7]|nr:hypothetical protein [Arthrobacter sp. MP_M4]MEC5202170.1 hypothetical protein [Arthrobacter sp. MP_M7]
MEDESAHQTPPLSATPRHLRRRALHDEVPDALLVPDGEPVPSSDGSAVSAEGASGFSANGQQVAYKRKRLIALISVIVVAVSVPALVLVLLLLG